MGAPCHRSPGMQIQVFQGAAWATCLIQRNFEFTYVSQQLGKRDIFFIDDVAIGSYAIAEAKK